MQYHQNSILKSSSKNKTSKSGLQIKQVTYDKEITQQWKVKTDNPLQILPHYLDQLCRSRLCDFWHIIKFYYFENYSLLNQQPKNEHYTQNQLSQEVQEYTFSNQKLNNAKILLKSIWKFTRNRMMFSLNKIKQQASFWEQQSSDLSVQNLDSYMRFLKLQDNRMQSAIQNLDSVFEKNIRRKLLEAIFRMKQHQKWKRRYGDEIKVQSFIEICERTIFRHQQNMLYDTFYQMIEYNQQEKNEVQRIEIEKRERQRVENEVRKRQQQNRIYKSVSNRKNRQQREQVEDRQTLIKNLRTNQIDSQQKYWQKQNNASTKKKQSQSNIKLATHNQSNIKSTNNQKIYLSEYYYDEQQLQEHQQAKQQDLQVNMNSLPTKRTVYNHNSTHSNKNVQGNYEFNQINNNIRSQKLQRKQNSNRHQNQNIQRINYNSHQIHKSPYSNSQFISASSHRNQERRQLNQQLHIPITQRIQRHNHQEYQQQQVVVEESQASNQQDNIQQIYILRNHTQRPLRKPDQYIKVPIISSNINLVQIPTGSQHNQRHHEYANLNVHSNSYYERKTCQNCAYCRKMKRVNQFVMKIKTQYNFSKKQYTEQNFIQSVQSKQIVIIQNQDEMQNQYGSPHNKLQSSISNDVHSKAHNIYSKSPDTSYNSPGLSIKLPGNNSRYQEKIQQFTNEYVDNEQMSGSGKKMKRKVATSQKRQQIQENVDHKTITARKYMRKPYK